MQSEAASDLYQRILAQMPEAVILADRDGCMRLWNRGAEIMFGHLAAEVMGKNLDIIIPDDLRQRHWEGYHRAMSVGYTRMGDRALPTRAVRKDGQNIYVELSFAIVQGETGETIGALAVGRNITERYTRDKAMRRRLATLEHDVAPRASRAGSGEEPE